MDKIRRKTLSIPESMNAPLQAYANDNHDGNANAATLEAIKSMLEKGGYIKKVAK